MLSKFSVKRPYTVLVAVVAVIVIGVVAMLRMHADLLPEMELPYVIVITTDMGASPEEVERNVTSKVEAALATTSNLEEISSMSYNSYSTVILEYAQTTNMDSTIIEIEQSIAQIDGTMGENVGKPMIMQLNPNMIPIMISTVSVEGMDNIKLTDYVNTEIAPKLEGIEGVASVNVSGGVVESVNVTVNSKKVDKLNKKIKTTIDKEFLKAEKEINDAQAQIDSGKTMLNASKNQLADQAGATEAELNSKKIELYQAEKDLDEKMSQAKIAVNLLEKVIDVLNKAKKKADELLEKKRVLEQIIQLYIDGLLDDAAFAESAGMTIDEARAQLDEINAGLDEINDSLADQAAYLAGEGIILKTYEDLTSAIATLTRKLTELKAGIAAMEAGKAQIAEGKAALDQGLAALTKGEIIGSLEISAAESKMAVGESQLEMAKTQIDSTKESAYNSADLTNVLSVDTVKQLLAAQNFDMPAGYVEDKDGQKLIKVGDDIGGVEDLKNTVLIDLGMDGIDPIKVSDVADVEVTDNSKEVYAAVNGEPGIIITFEKQTNYSTGEVTDNILKKYKSIENEDTGEKIHFATLMNQGIYIDIILKSILQNMGLGAILAILVLIIFLRDARPTVIIGCAIPISVVFAIVLMYFTSISLNIISLSGLALGIGMLVDNSIVVIENIYRMLKEGVSIKKACVYGASQVAGAITASTLTTMCVFLPIVFTSGITRQLFVDMGLTIAYTLTASLIVALTLVPAMGQGMLRKVKPKNENTENRFFKIYGKILEGALRFKALILIAVVLLFAGTAYLSISRGTAFLPKMSSTQITVELTVPEDEKRTVEEMTGYSNELMADIMSIPEVELTGAMMGNVSLIGGLGGSGGGNNISMYVLIKEGAHISNEEIESKIMDFAKDLDCDVSVNSEMMDMSALSGNGISVQVKGNDIEKLQELAAQVAEKVEAVEGTVDVDDGLGDMLNVMKVSVDKEKAAKYGMTVAQVFALVYAEIADTTSSMSLAADIKDYDVYINTDDQSSATSADIKRMTFEYTDKEGKKKNIRLSEIAKFTELQEVSSILRDSQMRYIRVSAGIDKDHNVGLVGNEVDKALKDLDFPEGYSYEMTGEDETINEAMIQLLEMLALALILIYLIMVAQFQSLLSPFIIMFTIPLAFTGGFFALYITGSELSVISMIGFVMLSGIIVNNGIVLVDYINQLRREGMSKKDAIIESGKTRLRPVIMTALTTIISMFTMALGLGQGTEMGQPMAIVVVGGLTYGTILTLVVVPCIYDIFNREKDMREEDLDMPPVPDEFEETGEAPGMPVPVPVAADGPGTPGPVPVVSDNPASNRETIFTGAYGPVIVPGKPASDSEDEEDV